MNRIGRRSKRSRARGFGMEISAALSAASQMALLYPPGYEEWVRRELTGRNGSRGRSAHPAATRQR